MKSNKLKRSLRGAIARIPLRVFLLVPFLIQVSSIVGLVGYLSYKSGQRAVSDLANQLMEKVSEQVSDRLDNYLQTPQKIMALNLLAVEQNYLDLENLTQIQQRFWRQIKIYDMVTSLQFVNREGALVAVGRDKLGIFSSPDSIVLASGRNEQRNYYLASETGKPTQLLHSLKNWDINDRSWYQEAIEKPPNTQTWSKIYPWLGFDWAAMNAIAPIYENGQFRGIFSSNVILSHVNLFLSDLEFSADGQVFILERSGDIVATSTQEKPFIKNIKGKELLRLPAVKSQDWLTRMTTREVSQQIGILEQIRNRQSLDFFAKAPNQKFWQPPQRYFTQVIPYRDEYGLDWLIVLTIPETEFMAAIYQNVRQTLVLVSFALMGSVVLGIYTSRWINAPILRLRNAARAIAQGNFESTHLPPVLVTELQELTDAFVNMGDRLQQSFQEMNRLNLKLSESQARLEKFLEAIPVGVAIYDPTGSLTYINQAAKQLLKLGIIADARIEEQLAAYQIYLAGTDTLYPADRFPSVRALAGEFVRTEDIEIQSDEKRIAIEAQATPVFDAEGTITHAIVAFQDITTRKAAAKFMADYRLELEKQVQEKTQSLQEEIAERFRVEEVLRENQIRFQNLADAVPGGIYSYVQRVDGSIEFEYVSRGIESIFSATVEEIWSDPQRFILGQMDETDRPGYLKAIATSAKTLELFFYEWRTISQSGELKWLQANSRPELRENGDICWHGIVLDISDRKQMETELRIANQQLEQLAQTDGLTQLANRRYFDRYLLQEWRQARREQQPLSMILLDIDYFKKFNDTYGHQAGDDCLRQVSQALGQSIGRSTDLVARYGGEEFAIVLPNTKPGGAVAIAQRVRENVRSLSIPHQASDVSNFVTVSIGISTMTPTCDQPEDLIKQADIALYRAKEQGRDRYIFI